MIVLNFNFNNIFCLQKQNAISKSYAIHRLILENIYIK